MLYGTTIQFFYFTLWDEFYSFDLFIILSGISLDFIFLLFIIQNTSVNLLLLLILRLICTYNLKDS
jgi:hypothetical protein